MKKIYIVLMLAAVFYAVSCNTQEEYGSLPTGEVMFTAVQADYLKSKTTLQSDGSVFWCAGDSIKLFYGSNGSTKMISNNSEPAQQTTFSGSLGEYSHNGRDYFHAVYPYSANNTFDGEAFTISLPEVQSSVAGSFADDIFISLARSRDYTLQFYNLCGGVKFSVAESGIKYVTFSGNNNEPLAGEVKVIFNEDGKPVVESVVDGKTELRLGAPDGGTFEPGEWYYIVSLPATLSAGYTMTFYKDEKFAERVTDSSVSIKRAVWGRLTDADNISASTPSAVDLGLPSGLKWASFNLGATAPEEYGDYFAWGETDPHYEDGYAQSVSPVWKDGKTGYNIKTYKFELGTSAYGPFSKYCIDSSNGSVDNKTILDPEDDAAHANWGSSWRMPTAEEWDELKYECTGTWTTQNGINGRKVTGPNGNSIFLPAGGNRNSLWLSDAGVEGYYWSSSLGSAFGSSQTAYLACFSSDYWGSMFSTGRYVGHSIRPVTDEGVSVAVTEVSLDKSSLSITEGDEFSFTATITPSNATQPNVIWSSSNRLVAPVDYKGKITAVTAGTAIITATTYDGGFTAACTVNVNESSSSGVPEAIDLGLTSGLKWASLNLGAICPEASGDYYAWGDIEPYYNSQDPLIWKDGKSTGYDWTSYIWNNGPNSAPIITKYVTNNARGTVDNKTVLELEDDAASVNWGGTWRIPTASEWSELIKECIWTWTTQNEVNGYLVTGINNNSIFLPVSSYWMGTLRIHADQYRGKYWSSSLREDGMLSAKYMSFDYNSVNSNYTTRTFGLSVRPVTDEGVRVSVTGVSLNKNSLSLTVDGTETLTANVTPSNATQPNVIWLSSNTSVAYVDYTGKVTAVAVGSATITATTHDGGFTASCTVTVSAVPEAVDLGLTSGLKWATCNVGANAPEEYGDYFAWGETAPYYTSGHSQDNPCSNWENNKAGYNWASYRLSNGSYNTQKKYCTDSSYGTVDNNTELDSEDDAAVVNWGGTWRMPTDADWTELRTECTWTWATQNGVNGYMVTGTNQNSIFLPAAGIRRNTELRTAGSGGSYWSSSLDTDDPDYAWGVSFFSGGVGRGRSSRSYGRSVRPVSE